MQDNDNSSESQGDNGHGGAGGNSGPGHSLTIKIDRETFKVSQETTVPPPESKAEPVTVPRLENVYRNGRSKALART